MQKFLEKQNEKIWRKKYAREIINYDKINMFLKDLRLFKDEIKLNDSFIYGLRS